MASVLCGSTDFLLCLLKKEVTLSRELLDLDFLVASFTEDVLPKLPISYLTKEVSDNAAADKSLIV